MQIRTGVDITEVQRIQEAIEKSGEAFLRKIFTVQEQQYCGSRGAHRYESFAARFAAKEAVVKALGTGFVRIRPVWIEVVKEDNGKPQIVLHESALEQYHILHGQSLDISLSHTRETAIAMATLLCGENIP